MSYSKSILLIILATTSALPFLEEGKNQIKPKLFKLKWDQETSVRVHGGTRIVGGNPAQVGQFPWQIAIYLDESYFCGGVLVSESWVLTAGHCVDGVSHFRLILGVTVLDEGLSLTSINSILHDNFNAYTLENDIGLVLLPGSVEFTSEIQPIPLNRTPLEEGVEITVSGFGLTSDDSQSISRRLQFVTLTTISNKYCSSVYGSLDDGVVCTNSDTFNGIKNTCGGDSGGPGVVEASTNPTLVAIVSFGSANGCESGEPAGLTRVAYHIEWIKEHTNL